jgi:pyruvate dehydrogenase E2 component (dihydrolipoamide acetyltransferase)
MAYEVVLPRLGWSMESGRLAAWLKQDGETVQSGEMIFSVEGDKAVQDVEALESGILRILPGGPGPDLEVPVGTLLAYICQPGEIPPFEQAGAVAVTQTQAAAPTGSQPGDIALAAAPGQSRKDVHGENKTISPRARRVARELAVDWSAVQGTGITGRIRERDIRAAALVRAVPAGTGPAKSIAATPLARRAAAELGVDLAALSRPGEGERITRADVEAAAQKAAPGAPESGLQAVPMGRLRKLIAERMAASTQSTAPVTLTTEVDATELFKMRKRWKADPDLKGQALPSYTDMLAKLVAQALSEHPVMNARLEGETLIYQESIHIAIAVDTPTGLVAPVVKHVQSKGLKQIARESAALVTRALAGRLSLEEVSGSTFTLTNLGMYDIDGFTPIINLPECAILGVGRMVAKVVVIDEESEATAVRRMMALSLTFDHRLVDGAPAARFLKRIRQLVEKPEYWLL